MDGGNHACDPRGMQESIGAFGDTPLAYRTLSGRGPGVIFLGGFHSDMTGSKAAYLAEWCAARGRAFLRFDYSGHGASGGRFEDGTIGRWTADAASALQELSQGPQILVGSSMGGWIALLLALRYPERVAGLVGIAAAPDFTEDLMWAEFSDHVRDQILREGYWTRPSAYGGAYPITRALIEDGRQHLLLGNPIALDIPIRLLHGQQDSDVPWPHSLRIAERVMGRDVEVTLIKEGDHRLSTPENLALLGRTLSALLGDDAA